MFNQRGSRPGFTLVELLIALAVIAVIAALAIPAIAHSLNSAAAAKCTATMRTLANGVLAYSAEKGEFPRSSHSAFAHRTRSWSRAVLPWVAGVAENVPNAEWRQLRARYFRCPSDPTPGDVQSYGLNVYFELDPEVDEYPGMPTQWRTPLSLINPTRTILLAETTGNTDHVMAHFWEGDSRQGVDCAHDRHEGKANYAFADGSIRRLELTEVFSPLRGIDLWNPGTAGQEGR